MANSVKIKICGITRDEDIDAVNAVLPDYIGFVFAPSKRRIKLSEAVRLRAGLNKKIIPVGVFQNADISYIAKTVINGAVDMIQLHGDEDGEYIKKLKAICDKPVIKAVFPPFDNLGDLEPDYFLLDSGAGTGVCFDWNKINLASPFFLAGGINVENIKKAINDIRPYAVDISSGAETDGVKDAEKIKELVRSVRNG